MPPPLSHEQRAELARVLQTRQQALEQQVSAHRQGRSRAEHASELLAQDGDDAPQRASDREVDLALGDIDQQQLAALARARDRIHDADYGLCADCGDAIPYARLHVEPEALRCVGCQSIHERKH
jgi:DnaK suppressor protein